MSPSSSDYKVRLSVYDSEYDFDPLVELSFSVWPISKDLLVMVMDLGVDLSETWREFGFIDS